MRGIDPRNSSMDVSALRDGTLMSVKSVSRTYSLWTKQAACMRGIDPRKLFCGCVSFDGEALLPAAECAKNLQCLNRQSTQSVCEGSGARGLLMSTERARRLYARDRPWGRPRPPCERECVCNWYPTSEADELEGSLRGRRG